VLVEEGGPRVEAKRRAGTPFLGPAVEPNFRGERAAACALGGRCVPTPLTTPQPCSRVGCPVHIRTANRTPETNTGGRLGGLLDGLGAGRKSSLQHRRSSVPGGKALRGARNGVQAPAPAGRLVRQPPDGVVRRRRQALVSWALRRPRRRPAFIGGALTVLAVASGSQQSALALGSQQVACASGAQQELAVVSVVVVSSGHADSSLSASGITLVVGPQSLALGVHDARVAELLQMVGESVD